jgi:hypothetical protein
MLLKSFNGERLWGWLCDGVDGATLAMRGERRLYEIDAEVKVMRKRTICDNM